MGKQELKYCKFCEKDTMQEWKCDADSEPDKPEFYLACLECSGYNDPEQSPVEIGVSK